MIQSFYIYNRTVTPVFFPYNKKIAQKLILSMLHALCCETFFIAPFSNISLIWFSFRDVFRGIFSWTGVLNKGILHPFTIFKISWSSVSFSQDWTKWEILPPGGTFCFDSSGNISFTKGWTGINFSGGTSSTEMLQKVVVTFFQVLPFDLLTVWLVVFLCHLCCCCVWKCWRRGILWFPALPLGDCLFLARNTVEKGYQPLWTSLINLLSTSLNISKVYFWALVLSSTCFRSWWPNSSVCLSITVRHCYLKVSNFEFSDTFNIFKSRKHCYLPDLAA